MDLVRHEPFVQAQILTQIHHKNLVSMIGYCKDGKDMALVYEYMPEGTLQEHITGICTYCKLLAVWLQTGTNKVIYGFTL